MAENAWILGINMTKFGKHPDKDALDLASEAALAALKDAGVTMKDIGVLAYGNLMGGSSGQMLQKSTSGSLSGSRSSPVRDCSLGAPGRRTNRPGRLMADSGQSLPSTGGLGRKRCPGSSHRSAWSTATNMAGRASSF